MKANIFREALYLFRGLFRGRSSSSSGLMFSLIGDTPAKVQCIVDYLGETPGLIERLPNSANGCAGYRLRAGSRSLKCYETESRSRAELVRCATEALRAQGVRIPRVLAVSDHFVFAEWVEGDALTWRRGTDAWERLCAYQGQIHATRGEAGEGQLLLHMDWLMRRLSRAASRYVAEGEITEVVQRMQQSVPRNLEVRVVVPDFIPPNVVEGPNGDWTLVDNEFLGIGTGFEFDVLNTARMLFPTHRATQESYLSYYVARYGGGTLFTHRPFWECCFAAKVAGKQFQQGNEEAGRRALEEMKDYLDACSE